MPDWMDAAMLAFKSNQKLALKQYCVSNPEYIHWFIISLRCNNIQFWDDFADWMCLFEWK